MTKTAQPRAWPPYLRLFTIWLIGARLGGMALLLGLAFAGLSPGGYLLEFIPVLVAANAVGHRWAVDSHRMPSKAEAWHWALYAAAITVAVALAFGVGGIVLVGTGPLPGDAIAIAAVLLAVIGLAALLTARFALIPAARRAFRSGAAQERGADWAEQVFGDGHDASAPSSGEPRS